MPAYDVRSKPEFMPGDKVRSLYRARWTGTVEEVKRYESGGWWIVQCRVEQDRCGRPVRKPFKSMWLGQDWLEAIKE